MQKLQLFAHHLRARVGRESRDISTGSRKARDEPGSQGLYGTNHDDRNRRGCPLGSGNCRICAGDDHIDLAADQVSDDLGAQFGLALQRAALQVEILPLDVAEGAHLVDEGSGHRMGRIGPGYRGNS